MTKILFISFVQPFPADDGKKVVLQGLVRYFLSDPNTHVDYMVLGGTGVPESPEARLAFRRLSHATRRPRLLMAVLGSFFGGRAPLQQALLYSEPLRQAVNREIKASNPDVVIYDTIRVSQFIENPRAILPKARHVLYLDDLFSVRYGAMLQALDRYPHARLQPLGNFAHHLPKVCQSIVNTRRLCRYLLRREMQLVKDVETAEVARFDVSLLVNRREVELLHERRAGAKVAAMPISLCRQIGPVPLRNYQGRPHFVFVGALNVPHNQCSIEYFIANVFEDCLRTLPGMKLRVIGQGASERLRRSFARYSDSIEWIEWVADLGNVFAQSAAMLVPLLFGSGVKVKTLEALAHGLPVVCTRFGAEGLLSEHAPAPGMIVEDDLRRFPQHMRSLLDQQVNDRFSRRAHEYFVSNYGSEAIAGRYKTLFAI